jgi:hypothetical protein
MVQIIIPITVDASAGAELFGERLDPISDASYVFQTVSCEQLTAQSLNNILYFTDPADSDSSDNLFWVDNSSVTQGVVSDGINTEVSGTTLSINTELGGSSYTNATVGPSDAVLGEHYVQYVASVLFGHPQAQAPIKNDSNMISQINDSDIGTQFVQKLIDDTAEGSGIGDATSSQGVVKAIFEQLLSLAHERFDISGETNDHTDEARKFRFETGDVIEFKVQMQGDLSIETGQHANASSNVDATAAAIFDNTPGVTYTSGQNTGSVNARTWVLSLQLL